MSARGPRRSAVPDPRRGERQRAGESRICGGFAELAVLGRITSVSVFAINLTTALGLGLGIDYALLMVARFREHLSQGSSVPEAVAGSVKSDSRNPSIDRIRTC